MNLNTTKLKPKYIAITINNLVKICQQTNEHHFSFYLNQKLHIDNSLMLHRNVPIMKNALTDRS